MTIEEQNHHATKVQTLLTALRPRTRKLATIDRMVRAGEYDDAMSEPDVLHVVTARLEREARPLLDSPSDDSGITTETVPSTARTSTDETGTPVMAGAEERHERTLTAQALYANAKATRQEVGWRNVAAGQVNAETFRGELPMGPLLPEGDQAARDAYEMTVGDRFE